MALTQGRRLGPYEIIAPLGAGGMGEVYRARDSKLGRDVAIKVLPPAFAADAARMARFEREAQTLAALNHPNIAAIYGIEQGAIVMELVEGEDLKGPVPVETALNYARQIAIALEAAHEKGIIHRDLKPANIKVTPDGVVKLLDFGLAKAAEETVPSAAAGTSPTQSPTISLAMTQAGMILGTAAYMSPEQARGKTVDKRADIWAFGVVLYELLAGRMLFGGGETVTDSIAAVLTREPDWNALPAETPPRVLRLMERCLRKDPKMRTRDIGEARLVLDDVEPELTPQQRRAWLPWALVAGLAVVVVAAVVAGSAWHRPKAPDPGMGAARFLLTLPEGTVEAQYAAAPQTVPSPDGRYLAFIAHDASGKDNLWVRPLGSVLARRLDKTEGANFPFWSPDAQFLAFFADDKLKKIAVSGGSPQTLCDAPQSSGTRAGGNGGTWNREGVIVFSPALGTPLMRVPAVGGLPTPVTSLEQAGGSAHIWPQFLPDGRHVLYLAWAADPAKSGIYVQELGSPTRVLVMKSSLRAAWAPPGYLLFVREGTLFAQRMDPKTFQLEGEPLSVAQDVTNNEGLGRAAFAVSQNGVLVYRGGLFSRIKQLAWFDRDGKRLGVLGQPGQYWSVALSPDEKNAAIVAGPRGRSDLWMMDLTSGFFRRMTLEQNASQYIGPWSPDSQRIAVNMLGGGIQELEVASGKINALTPDTFTAADWSPDGRSLLCIEIGRSRLSVLPLGGAMKPQIVQDARYDTLGFRFSPNGQFVAYTSQQSGTLEVFVASFPSFGVKRQISSGGGNVPRWTKDGRELFFREPPGTLMSAQIQTGPKIEATVPRRLFPYGDNGNNPYGNQFGVTADGKRFLILDPVQKTGPSAEIMVVLNWAAELKQP